jgi:hypothetical protein
LDNKTGFKTYDKYREQKGTVRKVITKGLDKSLAKLFAALRNANATKPI